MQTAIMIERSRPEASASPGSWRRRAASVGVSALIFVVGLTILFASQALVGTGHVTLMMAAIWWTVAALAVWACAEGFARKSTLPAAQVILAIFFASFAGLAIYSWLLIAGLREAALPFTASGTLLAFVGHYYRFRLPFTVFPVAAAGWLMTIGLVSILAQFATGRPTGSGGALVSIVTFIYGAGLFVWAGRADHKARLDGAPPPERAFWLHLLAGPMVALPVIAPLVDQVVGGAAAPAVVVLLVTLIFLFALVSLAADRMALVGAAIIYILAVPAIAHMYSPAVSWSGIAAAGLGVETAAVLLGVYWRPLRRRALRVLPTPWANWFAPPIFDR